MKQLMVDDNGNPRYIYADGNAVAETKSAAEMQAMELGKLQLAGMLQSKINSLDFGKRRKRTALDTGGCNCYRSCAVSKEPDRSGAWICRSYFQAVPEYRQG